MASRFGGPLYYCRRLVGGIFLTLTLVGGGAQESTQVDISFSPVIVQEKIPLRIRTNISWTSAITIERPELEKPLRWWALPYARPWSFETPEGDHIRKVEILATLLADEPGFHPLGAFLISDGETDILTEPLTLVAVAKDEKNFSYPVTFAYRSPPQELWQGEAYPIVLAARDLTLLSIADKIDFEEAVPGLMETADGYGSIETRLFEEDVLYDLPLNAWIWTPDKPGSLHFPGAQVSAAGLKRKVPGFTVNVRALPEEVEASGAVGVFSLVLSVPESPLPTGELVSVQVRAEGTGNLNLLRLPIPEIPGAILTSESHSFSYVPDPGGYKGWREVRYDFQVEEPGPYTISVPPWYWLDKRGEGRVHREGAREFSGEVLPESIEPSTEKLSSLLGFDVFLYRQAWFTWRNPLGFFFIIPGLVAALLIYLKKKKAAALSVLIFIPLFFAVVRMSPKESETFSAAMEAGNKGQTAEALTLYKELWKKFPNSPGILHDIAILMNEEGRGDMAVYAIRRALHLKPGNQKLHQTLESIEAQLQLEDQVPPSLLWPPWVVFTIWLMTANLVLLALAFYFLERKERTIISGVFALLMFLGATGVMFITDNRWHRINAVVLEDSEPLRKIPGVVPATDALFLPRGTTLSLRAITEKGCLVRSGYGTEGWLPRDSMLLITENIDEF